MSRINRPRDERKYAIRPLDLFGGWLTSDPEYAPTLAEARKIRTRVASGIGLPSYEIGIYLNRTPITATERIE